MTKRLSSRQIKILNVLWDWGGSTNYGWEGLRTHYIYSGDLFRNFNRVRDVLVREELVMGMWNGGITLTDKGREALALAEATR